MGIIHARVDDRLIHGQVATMWTNNLSATRIIVLGDEIVNDEMLKMSLKLATPAGVSLSVLSVDKAAVRISGGVYDSQRVFLIARSPKPYLGLVERGVKLDSINVGNITFAEGSVKVGNTVSVSQEDIEDFKKLNKAGVRLTMQLIPSNPVQDFNKIIQAL